MTCVSPRVAEAEWLVPRLRVHERKEKLLPVLRACLEGAPLCHLLCHQHCGGGRRREHPTRLSHHLDPLLDGDLFSRLSEIEFGRPPRVLLNEPVGFLQGLHDCLRNLRVLVHELAPAEHHDVGISACLSVRFQGFTPSPQYRPSASSRLWPARPAAL